MGFRLWPDEILDYALAESARVSGSHELKRRSAVDRRHAVAAGFRPERRSGTDRRQRTAVPT